MPRQTAQIPQRGFHRPRFALENEDFIGGVREQDGENPGGRIADDIGQGFPSPASSSNLYSGR